jgi:hypothetical protein
VNDFRGQKEANEYPVWGSSTIAVRDFREGNITMFSNHPPSLAAARFVGRTMLASFMTVFLAANGAAQSQQSVPDVTALSMEDLMKVQVTSVSKRTQKVADAAAAIFVITQEDFRRSGAY